MRIKLGKAKLVAATILPVLEYSDVLHGSVHGLQKLATLGLVCCPKAICWLTHWCFYISKAILGLLPIN